MTSLFSHPTYAEDQPSAHAILYLHVWRAAAMAGSFLAVPTSIASLLISGYRHKAPVTFSAFLPRLLTHSARGLVAGSVFGVLATWGQMRGREEIEWKDRSWRLLENKGEKDTDWVTMGAVVPGALVGALAARRGAIPFGVLNGTLGGAGVGMGLGVPYMISTFATGRKPR